jgi:anti-sigma factor RsiW
VSQMDRDRQPLLRDRGPVLGTESPRDLSQVQHSDVRERLSDYFEGALQATDEQWVRHHLDHCASCHAFAHTLDRTIGATRELPMHRLSDEKRRELLDRQNGTAAP